jgi:hypothetical protein
MKTIFLLFSAILVVGCAAPKSAPLPQYTGLTTHAGAVSGSLGKVREGGEGVRSHLRESSALLDQLDQKAAALLAQ